MKCGGESIIRWPNAGSARFHRGGRICRRPAMSCLPDKVESHLKTPGGGMRQALSCTAAKSMVQRTVEPILPRDSGAFAGDRRGKEPQDHVDFDRPPLSGLEATRSGPARTLARELADIGITRSDIDRIASEEVHS